MNSKFPALALVLTILLVFSAPAFASDCPDGTKNWECSTLNPGERCWNGQPVVTANPASVSQGGYGDRSYQYCPCPSGWNYNAAQDKCIKTSCTEAGVTKNSGQCFENSKPKYCNDGTTISKASQCGCPAGKQASGDECTAIPGYCAADADCGSPAKQCKDHACVDKQDCRYGKPYCLPSSEDCQLTDTGYKCVKRESSSNSQDGLPSQPDDSYLNSAIEGDNNSTGTTDTGASNPLACCCAPGAAMVLVGAFAFSRKKE